MSLGDRPQWVLKDADASDRPDLERLPAAPSERTKRHLEITTAIAAQKIRPICFIMRKLKN